MGRLIVGVCAGPSDKYERFAMPALERLDVEVAVLRGQRSIAEAYNTIVDQADGPVVLIHDDVELQDPQAVEKLAAVLDEPNVAVVGVIGSRNSSRASWHSGNPLIGATVDYCGPSGTRQEIRYELAEGDVDQVDGLLLGLSAWAVGNLRFDTSYPPFDGYDADICAQARAAGKRVVVAHIDVVHHAKGRDGTGRSQSTSFVQADLYWKSKWRIDAPRWRRAAWRIRGRTLPLEYRIRRLEWH